MARLALNKSSLTKRAAELRSYRQFLPSLDMKRRQLLRGQALARRALDVTRREVARIEPQVRASLPMLADTDVDLTNLACVQNVEITAENTVGIRLPRLRAVDVVIRPYSLLAKPHWVDRCATLLAERVRLHVHEQIDARRLALLEHAVKITTQRVKLFENVLIPRAKAQIKKIQLYLADAERAAVVRAKIAKRKRLST